MNVYLAVLYYTKGHYQTAIDHCTLVTRLQDHSQCSAQVVQGELLPKIDNDIDTVLGLAVFYQYVRIAALNQQQQAQYVSVFTTELFAHHLHIKCLSVVKCHQFSSGNVGQRVQYNNYDLKINQLQPFIADVLFLKSIKMSSTQKFRAKQLIEQGDKSTINSTKLDTSALVESLRKVAVEHLTIYRQLQSQKCDYEVKTATTDFEALYAYKRGDCRQCLQLSTQNVKTLLLDVRGVSVLDVSIRPEFIPLLDDDFASLIALTVIVDPKCQSDCNCASINQLTLSLYLMTQCQLKLRHSVTSLAQTLLHIEDYRRGHPTDFTLIHLTLKFIERKVMIYLASVI